MEGTDGGLMGGTTQIKRAIGPESLRIQLIEATVEVLGEAGDLCLAQTRSAPVAA